MLPPAPPTTSLPRLPIEIIVQIATLVADSPQNDGLPCLAALALGSRSFACAVAPLLARAAVSYDADRYLSWPSVTASSTAADAQVEALDVARRLPQGRHGYEYGAGPVLLYACQAGRAGLVQQLAQAAARINTLGKGGRGPGSGWEKSRITTTQTAGAGTGAEATGTGTGTAPWTLLLSPQAYLGAHFWMPFACANHMPLVWRLQGRAGNNDDNNDDDDDDDDEEMGDSRRHNIGDFLGRTTALHIAAQYGQLEVAEVILGYMKEDNSTSTSTNTSRLLRQAALDMPATLACTCPSAHMSAVADSCPDPLDWPWATPVVVALSHGHEAVARRLISAGAAWDHAPHWHGSRGIGVTHVAAAQRMAGMLEWLGGLRQQCSPETKTNTKTTVMTSHQGEGHENARGRQVEEEAPWLDWPDADGRFMLHHICDADMDTSLHSSARGKVISLDSDPDLSRLLGAIYRLGAFSRPSRRTLQAHIDRARAWAASTTTTTTTAPSTAASSSSSSPPAWAPPSYLKSLTAMEQDQLGELAAGYMTGEDAEMLQPAANEYAVENGLQQVARQMEEMGAVFELRL